MSLAGPGSSLGQRRHRRQVDGACRTDWPDPVSWRWRHDITWISDAAAASGSAAKDALKVGVGRCQATAEACPTLDGPVRRDRRHLGVARAGRASGLRPSSQASRAFRTMAALMSLPRPCDRSDGSRRPQDGYRVGGSGLSFREPNRPRKPTPRTRPEACQVCPDRNAVFSDCAPIPGATDHPISGERDAEPERPRRSGAATSGPRAKA